ncbi:class I SAM-dependent methyltransferase [Brucepastera parasyntrophica]|uniref:SAM-dependent methyltransferase n=1 Tax=Brucepastera parasyntrophica TaxID=2880008 RepID=UPI00210DA644|nr:class I SAM-dependent methyltransferase [Brucepastera parasyntrophica]ULQ58582.1 class I SAM-dependent methyltransferase [Brucepastera parasyntrophica]
MKSLEESIAGAMDCSNTEINAFLPYILQDFWEIGADPETIIQLVKKYRPDYADLTVLDLGSGKGAVSVKLSAALGCRCFGIDAIREFVQFAEKKAEEFGVESICTFEQNDIRTRLSGLGLFDVIILGAIGPVFGNYSETLSCLSGHLKPEGIIIIDDCYIDDDSSFVYPAALKKTVFLRQIKEAGMELAEEVPASSPTEIREEYDRELCLITARCNELIKQQPEKAFLFEEYIAVQKREYEVLDTELVCGTFVIRPA